MKHKPVEVVVVSQFNGTSTPKGSYRAKTGDNDCNVNSSRYSLRTALRESIRYQAKSEQNIRQDLIPTGATGRLLSCNPHKLVDHGDFITILISLESTQTGLFTSYNIMRTTPRHFPIQTKGMSISLTRLLLVLHKTTLRRNHLPSLRSVTPSAAN